MNLFYHEHVVAPQNFRRIPGLVQALRLVEGYRSRVTTSAGPSSSSWLLNFSFCIWLRWGLTSTKCKEIASRTVSNWENTCKTKGHQCNTWCQFRGDWKNTLRKNLLQHCTHSQHVISQSASARTQLYNLKFLWAAAFLPFVHTPNCNHLEKTFFFCHLFCKDTRHRKCDWNKKLPGFRPKCSREKRQHMKKSAPLQTSDWSQVKLWSHLSRRTHLCACSSPENTKYVGFQWRNNNCLSMPELLRWFIPIQSPPGNRSLFLKAFCLGEYFLPENLLMRRKFGRNLRFRRNNMGNFSNIFSCLLIFSCLRIFEDFRRKS